MSESQFKTVANYIRNQEQHHAKRDFAEEFIALLKVNVAVTPGSSPGLSMGGASGAMFRRRKRQKFD